MRTSQVIIVSTILLISLCGGINGIEIQLSALRSDLEYLRGYWLQNAGQSDREGRILFSNESQILVDFEKSTNPIQDEAWTKDFLRLRGIHELKRSDVVNAADEVFYKQGSFYIRRNPYALPESLPESDDNWISTLPISCEDDGRSSVVIQYIYLNSLASKIGSKVEQINSMTSKPVPLQDGQNAFPFDFVKGRTQLYVRHVQIIPFVPNDYSGREVRYVRSEEMPSIRFDRTAEKFFSVSDSELDERGFIRSSVGTYILRGTPGSPVTEEDTSREGKRGIKTEPLVMHRSSHKTVVDINDW